MGKLTKPEKKNKEACESAEATGAANPLHNEEQVLPLTTDTSFEKLDFAYLLLVHAVCADEQIHHEESKQLALLSDEMNCSDTTWQEAEKILGQAEDRLTLDSVAVNVQMQLRDALLNSLVAVIYKDGFCDPLERAFLDRITELWELPESTIRIRCAQAEEHYRGSRQESDSGSEKLSLGARMLRGADSILPESIIRGFQDLVPSTMSERIEELRQEILLAGPEYDEALINCRTIAHEDIEVTERILECTDVVLRDCLHGLAEGLSGLKGKADIKRADSAREVAEQLNKDCETLEGQIFHHLESVRTSLYRKKRSAKSFTISFLGKTKSGKSTLHAVVTGGGWNGIGVGAQRTTRLNRVYEWKNIRVIDTPGIGAPGGKSDEEVAKSVIDESDIICFVMTDNNQQESEFQFLRLRRARAKPLIILLNLKKDLTKKVHLQNFLKNPEALFSEDKRILGGHFDRIRRYAGEFYGSSHFDIVPVHLLAAQLARDGSQPEFAKSLYRESRIQRFLDTLRVGLVEHGVIRRSQTLLGCTAADIAEPMNLVRSIAENYQHLGAKLDERRKKALASIEDSGKNTRRELEIEIKKIFDDLKKSVSLFAEDHWDAKETALNNAWKKHASNCKTDQKLRAATLEVVEKFKSEVQKALAEIGRELQLISALESSDARLEEQESSMFWKESFKWGGLLLSTIGTIVLIWNPIGWVAVGIGLAAQFFSWLFEDKQEKRRKAVERITTSLRDSLEQQKREAVDSVVGNFDEQLRATLESIDSYFRHLSDGLLIIGRVLGDTDRKLQDLLTEVNEAYAQRVVDWVLDKSTMPQGVRNEVKHVDRVLRQHLIIHTQTPVPPTERLRIIQRVLQEEVRFECNTGDLST